jgi:hypothetical protein
MVFKKYLKNCLFSIYYSHKPVDTFKIRFSFYLPIFKTDFLPGLASIGKIEYSKKKKHT